MAHLHAHERDLEKTAEGVAMTLLQHPDWRVDALALRDRLDALIDKRLIGDRASSRDCECDRRGLSKDDECIYDEPCTATEPGHDRDASNQEGSN